MVKSSAEHLELMLDELLNVVRIRREKIYPEEIDFKISLEQVFHSLKKSRDYDNVAKEITIKSKNIFHTDKLLLNKILRNLIDNAIKFSNSNPGRIVNIKVIDFLKGVKIIIEDNGKGIDEQTRNNMFFMFYKGDNTTKGNGLGLYVVRNAVDRLSGFIDFKTEEQKFTRFEIYLPDLIDNSLQDEEHQATHNFSKKV